MANEQDIIVRIKAEGTGEFVKKLKDSGAQVEDVGDKVEKTEKRMSSSFKKIGGALAGAFAVGTIIQFTKALAKLAVDVDATEKKFKTVFGNASKIVEDFAKKNATSLGLTTSEFKKAAAAAGDLLIPMGFNRSEAAKLSSGLVKLSGALSAWSGGQFTASQTAEILTKSLLGEREQLKSLGISIQEADVKARLLEKGQSKLTGTMLQQAKATATYELILEKTVDAQAAFADDTQTLAEQQLVLKANLKEVGEVLAKAIIPFLSSASEKAIEFIDKIKLAFESLKSDAQISAEDLDNALGSIASSSSIAALDQYIEKLDGLIAAQKAIVLIDEDGEDPRQAKIDQYTLLKRAANDRAIAIDAEIKAEALAAAEAQKNAKRTRIVIEEERKEAKKNFDLTEDNTVAHRQYANEVKRLTKELKDFDEALKTIKKTTKELEPILDSLFFDDNTEAIDQLIDLMLTAQDEAFKVGLQLALGLSKAVPGATKVVEEETKERVDLATEENRTKIALAQEAFNFANVLIDRRQANLQSQLDNGLISEKEFAKESAELQRKAAIANKAQAAFEIGINTAVAITSALGQVGRGGLVLAALAGALGAAQLASVLASPIPKFAKGTRKVGDGYEMGEDRTLAWLNSGERVVTKEDNKKHWKMLNALEDNDTGSIMKALAGYGIAVQFDNNSSLLNQLDLPMKTLKEIKEGKRSGVDLSPLLTATDRQKRTLAGKLDKIHDAIVKQSTHRMTRA